MDLGDNLGEYFIEQKQDHKYILRNTVLKGFFYLIRSWWNIEINSKRKYRNYTNTWRMKNTLMNDEWVVEKIKEKFNKFQESNENESTT